MSSIWIYNSDDFLNLINDQKYLQRLLSFPVDIQDKIIEDISNAPLCTKEEIAKILTYYAMLERNRIH
ncbi:hypothetical protein [Colwellia sp. UCD-KL20]|uniref:hypothetical protein n=1 Tax=Colwellia sp. UCD-KL20 TaxID=1917165 RepID=UPI000970D6CA|nr:hypothetical protein [Colwellia sp. UCD-KL20]